MSAKDNSIAFVEYMEVTINIECQSRGCKKHDGAWCDDEYNFAKRLWKKGWRLSKRGTLYCPACAKKHLTKNK